MRWFNVWAECGAVVTIRSHSQAMALLKALDEMEPWERVVKVEEVKPC